MKEEQEREAFELDNYREAWNRQGEQWKDCPLMSDEDILKAVGSRPARRLRPAWRVGVAVAATLLIGVGVLGVYLHQQTRLGGTQVAEQMVVKRVHDEVICHAAEVKEDETPHVQPEQQQVVHKSLRTQPRPMVASAEQSDTEVTCNSSCDSSAVLGQIRSFLMDKEA